MLTVRSGKRPVVAYQAYPPGQHPPFTPIVPHMTALRMINDRGESSWWGVDEAKINAQLRMIVRGGCINPRNELTRKWRRVPRKFVP